MSDHPSEPGEVSIPRNEQKRLITEIQAVLQSFDRAKEWADLNNALQRLQKCISKPILTYIPHKEIVCKRLAQCLNPQLPSGVHTRTLEVYASILQKIGPAGLIKDLALFSSGLFPFFSSSSTSVRPIFLNIIEAFYIPLGEHLLPCLIGLLLCILPGLEDDKGDCFEKVHETLNHICDCVTETQFMWALWTILLKASKIRYSTLQVLSLRLSPGVLTLPDERLDILLPNRETLVLGALIASFRDGSPQVNRSLSNMLVNHFPLHWEKFTKQEKVALISCTLLLINKAEWSFVRGIYKWLFNISHDFFVPIHLNEDFDDDEDDEGQYDEFDDQRNQGLDLEYFCKYVKSDFIEAIRELLQVKPTTIDELLEPIKMIVSLVSDIDLHGLANEIMPDLSIPIIKYVSSDCENSEWRDELVSRAKVIFDPTITPTQLIFDVIGKCLRDLVSSDNADKSSGWDELLQLLYIYIEQLNSNPTHLITGIMGLFNQSLTSLQAVPIESGMIINILMFITKILKKIDNMLNVTLLSEEKPNMQSIFAESLEIRKSVIYFLQHYYNGALQKFNSLPTSERNALILDLLNNLAINLTRLSLLGWDKYRIPAWISTLVTCSQSLSDIFTCPCTRTLIEIMKLDNRIKTALTNNNDLYNISSHLYNMLDVKYESSHSEIVFLLIEMHKICTTTPSEVEKTLFQALLAVSSLKKMEAISRFSVLWKYSNIHFPSFPVFPDAVALVLDFVTDQDPHIRYHARSFLSDVVINLPHLIDNIIITLISKVDESSPHSGIRSINYVISSTKKKSFLESNTQNISTQTPENIVRMFKHLTSILTCEGQTATEAMQRSMLSLNLLKLIENYKSLKMPSRASLCRHESKADSFLFGCIEGWFPTLIDVNNDTYDDECIFDYVDLLVVIALNYICINVDISYLMSEVNVERLELLHSDIGLVSGNVLDGSFGKSFLECGEKSNDEDTLTMFRCTAIEFLKLLIATIQPASRAKEVACLISRPLLSILLYFYLQGEHVVQTQLLLLLKVVLHKSHLSGPLLSKSTKKLIEMLHGSNLGDDSSENLPEDIENPLLQPAYTSRFDLLDGNFNKDNFFLVDQIPTDEMFIKIVTAKKKKSYNLCSLSENPIFGLILLICSSNNPLVASDILQFYVDFSLLALRYMSPQQLNIFTAKFIHEFSIQIRIDKKNIGIEGLIIYLKGLYDLCGYVVNIISQNSSEQPGINSGLGKDSDNDPKNQYLSASGFNIYEVIESCIQCLVSLEVDSADNFTQKKPDNNQFSIVLVRGVEAVGPMVLSIFNLLYLKLPYYFAEGCLANWDKCHRSYDTSPENLTWVRKTKKITLAVLRSIHSVDLLSIASCILDMYEKYCKTDLSKDASSGLKLFGCFVRESCMMDFIHELLKLATQKLTNETPDVDREEIVSVSRKKNAFDPFSPILEIISRIAALIIRFRRQPIMSIWGLHLYISIDQLIIIRSIHLENKNTRKRISTLVYHVILGACKNFHKTGSTLSPNLYDLNPPLPQYLEHLYEKICYRHDIGIDQENQDEVTFLNVDRLACNSLGQLIMFCYDICHLKRTSPLAGIILRVLCENMNHNIVPCLIKKTIKEELLGNAKTAEDSSLFLEQMLAEQSIFTYKYLLMQLVDNLPYSLYTPCFYYMKQAIIDWINSQHFFHVDRRSLLCLIRLVSKIIQQDIKEGKGMIKLDLYLPPYSTSVFSLKFNDMQQRSNYLKRLSFLIYSCKKDTFASHISRILELLTDNIRSLGIARHYKQDDYSELQKNILLTMRILLLKTSQEYLTVLWPVLLSELIEVFDRTSMKLRQLPSVFGSTKNEVLYEDKLLLEAIKTINVACSLRLYDFLIFQWIFVPSLNITSALPQTFDNIKVDSRFLPFYTIVKYLYEKNNHNLSCNINNAIETAMTENMINITEINRLIENDLMDINIDIADIYKEISIHDVYSIYKNTFNY